MSSIRTSVLSEVREMSRINADMLLSDTYEASREIGLTQVYTLITEVGRTFSDGWVAVPVLLRCLALVASVR